MNPLRARLPIAEIGSNDKHVAGEAEREQSLILETDIHTKNSIVDGMANVIDAGLLEKVFEITWSGAFVSRSTIKVE
jgi:hypothetical protein